MVELKKERKIRWSIRKKQDDINYFNLVTQKIIITKYRYLGYTKLGILLENTSWRRLIGRRTDCMVYFCLFYS